MYLAQQQYRGKTHYLIRESFWEADVLTSRDLFDLGGRPERYIVYPGGNAYYVHESVSAHLSEAGVDMGRVDVEELFWPFVRPDIRHAMAYFRSRGSRGKSRKESISAADFHLFDRRRVHYLRFGQMDQGYIGRVSPRLFRVLAGKSRDEVEQYFLNAELILRPRERKSYVFVIFNIQRHFSEHFAKTMPQALDQRAVDQAFLADLCHLNGDEQFWSGYPGRWNGLQEYLVRYLIMYFDHDYGQSAYLEDIIQSWINRKRAYHPPPPRSTVSVPEAATIFGVSETELGAMSGSELSRIFRRKAQEFHPDKGGDHETFIRLTEAYQEMKNRKK